ncbi:MAG: aldo/keto reductase [Phycisphaerales bacterium]
MKYTRRDLIQMGVGGSVALLAGWRPVWAQAIRSADVTSQRKRPIPSTGERIPCMGLGTSRTFNADTSDEQRAPLKDVLRLFHEMGGTVLDTAPSYGNAEIVSGDLMRDLGIRSDLFVATKVRTSGQQEGVEQMQASLRRLGTERVDLMQVHNLMDIQTQLPTVRQWKDQGRVRYAGMTTSSRRQYEDFEHWMKSETLDFVQLDYSIGQREAAKRLLPLAAERGMAVMVNRPFLRGRLFQKTRGQALPEWCAEFECSSWGQFFLKYVLSHPAVTVVIPATSKSDHLRDNMAAGLGRLPDEVMRKRMEGLIDAL